VYLRSLARRELVEDVGGHEDQVGVGEELPLGMAHASRSGRTFDEPVDAVIDDQRRIDSRDHLACERCRQERDHHDGTVVAGQPSPNRAKQDPRVQLHGEPGIRKRQEHG
jgi:hypothetical protein